ncbi:MAG: carboxypeptidase-like regulatory domain-containing protein [Cytophagales bacterium]|nr:carboxypeptidase-like regulatory domain-containing protein [Cytophagales bacterium]
MFLLASASALAQPTVIHGMVKDTDSNEPLPFVNVYIKSMPSEGVVTDVDGRFSIRTNRLSQDDYVVASYIGYISKTEPIKAGKTQRVLFKLSEETKNLEEVTVKAGENPAYPIIRRAAKNKSKLSFHSLDAINYHCYNASEVYLNEVGGLKSKAVNEMKQKWKKMSPLLVMMLRADF